MLTRNEQHLELLIGYENGEVQLREVFSRKDTWFNPKGVLTQSPVSAIKWVPGTEKFVVAHHDGSLFVFDKVPIEGAEKVDKEEEEEDS